MRDAGNSTMRTSTSALALITRPQDGEAGYLAQWNPSWAGFHLIGGRKQDDESFRACAAREVGEELGVSSNRFSAAQEPTAHLNYVAWSRRTEVETSYAIELFEIELDDGMQAEVGRRPENAWLSPGEIVKGAAHDGRAISPTMRLLLEKSGRLPAKRDASVWTLGVSGHRDLCGDDLPKIRKRLGRVFNEAERTAAGRAIQALSPLAAGADQLFAAAALDRGWRLVSPLPLPLDLYRREFCQGSVVAAEELLQAAAEWYSLPVPQGDSWATDKPDDLSAGRKPLRRAGLAKYGPARDLMYEAAGRHVVDRCDVLVALWDGEYNGKRGGTGEIVRYARREIETGRPLQIEIFPVRRESKR